MLHVRKRVEQIIPSLPLENSFENFSFAGKLLTLFPRQDGDHFPQQKRDSSPAARKQDLGISQQKIYISVDFIHVMI